MGLGFCAPASANEVEISGQARVIDGDTIEVAGTPIRIIGIDAPETGQSCQASDGPWDCGEEASATMTQIIDGRTVNCHSSASDIYGRMLALCRAGSLDIGFAMVQGGMAIASRDAPPEYQAAESRIKGFKIGIWGSEFQRPADWRADHPREIAAKPKAKPIQKSAPSHTGEQVYRNQFGCAIKGNRNRRGEWIYHLPGRPYYDGTRPEELFCTEAEARRAGYRRSKA